MPPLTWLALAAALAVGGRARTSRAPRHARPGGRPRAPLPPRALATLAAMGVATCCLLLTGSTAALPAAGVLAPAAAALTRRLAARPASGPPDRCVPVALDLTAAALRAGQTVAAAFALTAPVLPVPLARRWERAAGLLALGAEPEQAWSVLAEERTLAPVAAAARRSADSGARLAQALTQLAVDVRAEIRAAALSRAGRTGVLVLAPLGACFLPAFVCLGIVPTVVGIARDVLPGR